MVKWQGRRESANVDDRRGAAAAGGAGIIFMVLRFVVGRFGIRGVMLLAVVGLGLYMVGVNPVSLLGGQPVSTQRAAPADDDTSRFVRVILAETEDVWSQLFGRNDYPEPTLVLFSGSVTSACGYASAASGPFYCPGDKQVYLDTSFFNELAQRFGAPGDFAAAYVIAHEVGHHVQTVTGISNQVRSAQQRARSEAEANALQVKMELQADCYAGVWAHYADRTSNILEEGDIEEGLRAAEAIGDDTLQRNAGRRVTPESFTHGTSQQRQEWFTTGYRYGDVSRCDTFG
ncbi:neutral zinc metallopeptidase [Hyphococcus sp. DH-69]|uniref:KPN_02809 family neutral zinc metallopeptidase n=1 Tax=Hyphococcus formosus TaxID=3143534 RepID=UPI00398B088B